jgi:uncharacterized RDD family membrane protein YckC
MSRVLYSQRDPWGMQDKFDSDLPSRIVSHILCFSKDLTLVLQSHMVSSDERRKEEEKKKSRQIILANWGDRFLAWIVDFILVSIALAVLFSAIAIPIWFFYYDDDMTAARAYQNVQPSHYIISSLAFLGYWTYFESTSGQSIGKRLLKIKTIDLSGNRIDIKSALIESFGKAFLLPIDVILGLIFTNNKRQRIFNRISNTIVIKLKKPELRPEDIIYTKD